MITGKLTSHNTAHSIATFFLSHKFLFSYMFSVRGVVKDPNITNKIQQENFTTVWPEIEEVRGKRKIFIFGKFEGFSLSDQQYKCRRF